MAALVGQVVVNYGRQIFVLSSTGAVIDCVARRAVKKVVAGDFVEYQLNAGGQSGVVEKQLPRETLFERPDKYGKVKALAANITQVFIVIAPQPAPIDGLIDHYLVACHSFGFKPVLLLNKIELSSNAVELNDMLAMYKEVGYPVIHTSCKVSPGLAELEKYLANEVSMFVGQSGVGKSSIVSRICPDDVIRTGALSTKSGEGTHTTTATTLYPVNACDGAVVDSPGVREFRITNLTESDIKKGFPEIHACNAYCKFNNCTHTNEPQCEVKARVAAKEIPEKRYASYQRMLDTVNQKN